MTVDTNLCVRVGSEKELVCLKSEELGGVNKWMKEEINTQRKMVKCTVL